MSTVFTLPTKSLPSQYRALLPVTAMESESFLSIEKKSRTIRRALFGTIALLITFIIIVVALIVALKLSDSAHPLYDSESQQTYLVDVISVSNHTSNTEMLYPVTVGERCGNKCSQYSSVRFNSTCSSGFCRCQSKDYDSTSCLPRFMGCQIQTTSPSPSLKALYAGYPLNTYTCDTQHKIDDDTMTMEKQQQIPVVIVISVFKTLPSQVIDITLFSKSAKNVTLVLASQQPNYWHLKTDKTINVHQVVFISRHGVNVASLSMETQTQPGRLYKTQKINTFLTKTNHYGKVRHINNKTKPVLPKISRFLSHIGYGNDRMDGNTPHLFRKISALVGPVHSFVGVAHADSIRYMLH